MSTPTRTARGEAAPELAALADAYWQDYLERHPVEATALGTRTWDDRLEDVSREASERDRTALLARLEAVRSIDPSPLGDQDRRTRDVLVARIEGELAEIEAGLERWGVDPLGGLAVELQSVEAFQPIRTVREGEAYVTRCRAMGRYVDQHIVNLGVELERGRVAVRDLVDKVVEQLDELIEADVTTWPMLRPSSVERDDWSDTDGRRFADRLSAAATEVVRPALVRYRDYLAQSVRPEARASTAAGIGHLPGGADDYQRMIRLHTTLDRSPLELHRLGVTEVERISAEIESVGGDLLAGDRAGSALSRLRTDPDHVYASREDVLATARRAVERAWEVVPEWFDRLPSTPCRVVAMEEHEERHSTIAYYRPPAADGSRPGQYYVNTHAPTTRPRYEAEALAYHEAVPGHHLQISLAQELRELPAFRRHRGATAFVEGWALYAERLADEIGLYSSALDRIGMLSFESWRACRLVVDTGIHALGWSRARAIEFMAEHTALTSDNVANEIDRYIAWPGQALAYKVGQLEVLALRDRAERELGERFDLRGFHAELLRHGSIPLEPLRRVIDGFIDRRRGD